MVIHEKYERQTKWTLRILTLLGITLSVVSIPSLSVRLGLAVALVLVEQLLERAVFLYTTIYVQPLPNFTYAPEEWLGMGFAFPINPGSRDLNIVGPVFKSQDYAHRFFETVREWNYGSNDDVDNNVCLSFIIEKSAEYSTYLYPNLDRQSIKQASAEAEEELKFEKFGKEHDQLVIQPIFCKLFPHDSQSQLNAFIQKQSEDRTFLLQPFVQRPDGSFEILLSEQPILKHHVTIKKREELHHQDVEYQHGKYVMGR